VPEPNEQQRRDYPALLFVVVGCFALSSSVVAYLTGGIDGILNNGFPTSAVGLAFLLQALSYALPAHRHRARLVVRAAITLTFLALAASAFLVFGGNSGRVWLGAAVTLAFLLVLFCINYFSNRRRARKSWPTM